MKLHPTDHSKNRILKEGRFLFIENIWIRCKMRLDCRCHRIHWIVLRCIGIHERNGHRWGLKGLCFDHGGESILRYSSLNRIRISCRRGIKRECWLRRIWQRGSERNRSQRERKRRRRGVVHDQTVVVRDGEGRHGQGERLCRGIVWTTRSLSTTGRNSIRHIGRYSRRHSI